MTRGFSAVKRVAHFQLKALNRAWSTARSKVEAARSKADDPACDMPALQLHSGIRMQRKNKATIAVGLAKMATPLQDVVTTTDEVAHGSRTG